MEKWEQSNRQIATWLRIGVIMIIIQFLLGSITRLTESGLSITEWKPITGVLPPLNQTAWQHEFDLYKTTDQFKYLHENFSLNDFKFIFFWEWFHRLWARLMGVVFAAGFIYFLMTKKFTRNMIAPMAILFLLGGLQGAIGWIMVKSGLVPEKFFVGHIELTTHFMAAIILLVYCYWFSLKLLPQFQKSISRVALSPLCNSLLLLFCVQLIYGGFMAGLKAAMSAPTWPSINGSFLPRMAFELRPTIKNIVNNNLMVQFVHRTLAYLILGLGIWFFTQGKKLVSSSLYQKYNLAFVGLLSLQVVLGIFTVITSTNPHSLLFFGVIHQLVAILTLLALVTLKYFLINKKPAFS